MENPNNGPGSPPSAPAAQPGQDIQKELETAKTELESLKTQGGEKDTRIAQAEHVIENLKRKLKEAGISEEDEAFSQDQVKSIVSETVKAAVSEATTKLNEGFQTQMSELKRTIESHNSSGLGGGSGQNPPQTEAEPELSLEDKKILDRGGFVWNPEKKAFVSKSGRMLTKEELSKETPLP